MAGKTQLTLEEGSEATVTRGGLQVAFNAAGITVTVDGKNIVVDSKIAPETDSVAPEIASAPANDSLVQKVLEVGDRLKDGTVCIAVDLKKNEALFAPAAIFGDDATFDKQHEVPALLNKWNVYGHNDWRNITDDEGKTLSLIWEKVVPDELKGRAPPWFWLSSPYEVVYARVRRGGDPDPAYGGRDHSFPVPVVRSGPARS